MSDTASGKKITVIEDEPTQSKILSGAFTAAGLQVSTARTGVEGLETVLREKPDIATLDIAMPDMNGLEFLRKLRADPWGATLPVIILSNYDDPVKVAEALGNGVQYYLVKINTSVADIVQKVQEVLATHTARS